MVPEGFGMDEIVLVDEGFLCLEERACQFASVQKMGGLLKYFK